MTKKNLDKSANKLASRVIQAGFVAKNKVNLNSLRNEIVEYAKVEIELAIKDGHNAISAPRVAFQFVCEMFIV